MCAGVLDLTCVQGSWILTCVQGPGSDVFKLHFVLLNETSGPGHDSTQVMLELTGCY